MCSGIGWTRKEFKRHSQQPVSNRTLKWGKLIKKQESKRKGIKRQKKTAFKSKLKLWKRRCTNRLTAEGIHGRRLWRGRLHSQTSRPNTLPFEPSHSSMLTWLDWLAAGVDQNSPIKASTIPCFQAWPVRSIQEVYNPTWLLTLTPTWFCSQH